MKKILRMRERYKRQDKIKRLKLHMMGGICTQKKGAYLRILALNISLK